MASIQLEQGGGGTFQKKYWEYRGVCWSWSRNSEDTVQIVITLICSVQLNWNSERLIYPVTGLLSGSGIWLLIQFYDSKTYVLYRVYEANSIYCQRSVIIYHVLASKALQHGHVTMLSMVIDKFSTPLMRGLSVLKDMLIASKKFVQVLVRVSSGLDNL